MMLMKAMEARKKAEVSTSLCKFEVFVVSLCSDLDKSSIFHVFGCIIQLEQQISSMFRVVGSPSLPSHGFPTQGSRGTQGPSSVLNTEAQKALNISAFLCVPMCEVTDLIK